MNFTTKLLQAECEFGVCNAIPVKEEGVIKIVGMANVFSIGGEVVGDLDGDSISPYGVDLSAFNKNPVMLYNHNRDMIIGKFTNIELRNDGIFVEGLVYRDCDPRVYNAVEKGLLKTFSIGFRGQDGKYIPEQDIYVFTKVLLLECSIVTVPANSHSVFEVVESKGIKEIVVKSANIESPMPTIIPPTTDDIVDEVVEVTKQETAVEEVVEQTTETVSIIVNETGVDTPATVVEAKQPTPEELFDSIYGLIDGKDEDTLNSLLHFHDNMTSRLNNAITEAVTNGR